MFTLDDKFLAEVGLDALPPQEKPKMRGHIYETLEMRVGMKLASGMSDTQLDEFEGLIGGDMAKARGYLTSVDPAWEQSQNYQNAVATQKKRAEQENRQPNVDAVITEFASLKWLETNFPNYKQVVAQELEKLKAEIQASAPQIIAAATAQPDAAN